MDIMSVIVEIARSAVSLKKKKKKFIVYEKLLDTIDNMSRTFICQSKTVIASSVVSTRDHK